MGLSGCQVDLAVWICMNRPSPVRGVIVRQWLADEASSSANGHREQDEDPPPTANEGCDPLT